MLRTIISTAAQIRTIPTRLRPPDQQSILGGHTSRFFQFRRALRVILLVGKQLCLTPLLAAPARRSTRGRGYRKFAELGHLCTTLRGGFLKIGQILSTRADLIPDDVRSSLEMLQDKVEPMPTPLLVKSLQYSYDDCPFRQFNKIPLASATIAQVHTAVRADDGRPVALKIRKEGVTELLIADCRIARAFARIAAFVPAFKGVPLAESINEITSALLQQTDFNREAVNHERMQAVFATSSDVLVPKLHRDLCTETVLCMDLLQGLLKISDPIIPPSTAKRLLTIGVRSLFSMIFTTGLIHCDLHPGNMLAAADGRLVILDAGFMTTLDDDTRISFAQFFLAIALGDGRTAARIIQHTASRLPPTLKGKSFESDIISLVEKAHGLRAGQFDIATFVRSLFAIQRQHGIYGTSKFSLAILSLLVFEGLTRQRFPDLNFQQEAIPFAVNALSQAS